MVSGSISLRYSRFFSPFPHGTGSLSVSQEYLALADGPPNSHRVSRAPRYSGYHYSYLLFHTGLSPSLVNLSRLFRFNPQEISWSYNPSIAVTTLVWANPRSLATTYGITFCFLLLRLLRCFSSAGLLTYRCTMSST